jgi:hypothetical protein
VGGPGHDGGHRAEARNRDAFSSLRRGSISEPPLVVEADGPQRATAVDDEGMAVSASHRLRHGALACCEQRRHGQEPQQHAVPRDGFAPS